jgi:2',3'-cyclic-nucleotide 2'-phosphodiesterase (5'-nucleotidase family)
MQADGAEVIIVLAHDCGRQLRELSKQVADLGIPLIAGGHCHNLAAERDDHTVILQGGQYYQGYAYVTLELDADTGEYKTGKYGTAPNLNGAPDPYLAALAQYWELKWEAEKQRLIAFLSDALPAKSDQLGRLIGHAWLEAMPEADLTILARGLLHESLAVGEVTVGDITALLSPRHTIIEVELTGEQVRQVLSHGEDPVVTGLHQVDGIWMLDRDGEPLGSDQVYRVLVDSSMYMGDYGYELIGEFNPQGANTGIDSRTPVIEWLESQNSTAEHPLELLPELSEG